MLLIPVVLVKIVALEIGEIDGNPVAACFVGKQHQSLVQIVGIGGSLAELVVVASLWLVVVAIEVLVAFPFVAYYFERVCLKMEGIDGNLVDLPVSSWTSAMHPSPDRLH